ncbi:MAG: hypothetical protein JKY60_09370 [Kordiimonadaceae bacterium]|nr:hypothetical protein [Kordiimonadaceae bacterium]
MLANNFRVAARNIKGNKLYALINIIGLALGLVVVSSHSLTKHLRHD